MHAIVLTFDRLPAGLIGCWGNEWVETPHLDRLATHSELYTNHLVEIPGPAGPRHPWWTGRLEFFDSPAATTLFEQLADAGVNCRLISERAEGLPTGGLSHRETVTGVDGLDVAHADVPIAKLVSRAIELLPAVTGSDRPELLWLHSRGVPSPWLPPEFFAGLYLDELEDEQPDDDDDEFTDVAMPDPHHAPAGLESTPQDTPAPVSAESIVNGLTATSRGRELADAILQELRRDPALIELLLTEPGDPTPPSDNQFDDEFDGREAGGPEAGGNDESRKEPAPDSAGEPGRMISRYIFAGYVSLIDHWIGRLIEAIGDQNVLLIVAAASGHDTGDRAEFLAAIDPGAKRESTIGELSDAMLRTPLLVRHPAAGIVGIRHRDLVQPSAIATVVWQCLTGTASPDDFTATPLVKARSSTASPESPRPAASDDRASDDRASDDRVSDDRVSDPELRVGDGAARAWHAGRDGSLAVSEPDWFLTIRDAATLDQHIAEESLLDSVSSGIRLSTRPDDLHDINDVSRQHHAEVARLLKLLRTRIASR